MTALQRLPRFFIFTAAVVFAVYFPLLIVLVSLERSGTDLDGRPQSSFPVHGGDSAGYMRAAENMLNHGVFSLEKEAPFLPDSVRTPGYPAFAAALRAAFGTPLAVSVAQIFIAAATALLIAAMGARLFSRRIGVAAGALYLVNPSTIFYSFTALTDVLFIFCFLAALYMFFFAERAGTLRNAAAAGAILALSIYIRPIGLYLLPLWALAYIWVRPGLSVSLRQAAARALIFLAVCAALIAPWIVRNRVLFGVWGFSSAGAVTLYYYDLPQFIASQRGVPTQRVFDEFVGGRSAYEFNTIANASQYQAAFFNEIAQDPAGYAAFHAVKTIPFFVTSSARNIIYTIAPLNERLTAAGWFFPPKNFSSMLLAGEFRLFFAELKTQWWFMLEHAWWALIAIAALAAVFIRRDRWKEIVLLGGTIGYFAAVTGPISNAKYRLPVEPLLFILAFAALGGVWIYIRKRFFSEQNFNVPRATA